MFTVRSRALEEQTKKAVRDIRGAIARARIRGDEPVLCPRVSIPIATGRGNFSVLLDSGANCCVMPKCLLSRFNPPLVPKETKYGIRLVGDQVMETTEVVDFVVLWGGEIPLRVTAYVLDVAEDMFLFGYDFLKGNKISLMYNDRAVLDYNKTRVIGMNTKEDKYTRPVAPIVLRATKGCVISPGSAAMPVSVVADDFTRRGGVWDVCTGIAEGENPSLVTLTKGRGHLPVRNTSGHEYEIKKGDVLGTFSPTQGDQADVQRVFASREEAFILA